jgi:hypothetical protein
MPLEEEIYDRGRRGRKTRMFLLDGGDFVCTGIVDVFSASVCSAVVVD